MNNRDLVWKVFHNESAERVPVGFWFHFAGNELEDVFLNPGLRKINREGHRTFFKDFKPDFLKIMTDGYFCYPNGPFARAVDPSGLEGIKPIGPDHPWIREQVGLAKEVAGAYGKDVLTFFNIFSPATIFKFARSSRPNPDGILADFISLDKGLVANALNVVAQDFAVLAKAVIEEGGADGIYYSVQDVLDPRINALTQRDCTLAADFAVLKAAQDAGGLNILHVCSYAGHHNEVARYVDYPAQVINWAASLEKLPLGEGKKLFGGKPVIGGFDNTASGLLYRGSRGEIEAETDRLLAEAGRVGVALGADCTIPRDITIDHLKWVRDRAAGRAI
jgi:uroporphyrinogen decarboxylase